LTLGDGRSPNASTPSVQGRITEVRQGLSLDVASPWGSGALTTRLLGRFNAYNLLAAVAVACVHGHRLDAVLERLHGIEPIVGRMQRMGGDSRPLVVVDYSHTPDALRNALAALRPHCQGALWCVFGCGGERDRGKRPQMAEAVQRGADRIIVTDDNPRGENGDTIIADIMEGFTRTDAVQVERDRGRAIHRAISGACAADVVLIAGKGHEVSQERDGAKLPFSDVAVVRRELEAWK
jgi:UDP-N-acetylmuramoyl-L-alanyl-D-glutamate--2,6-diaminopimelate ligase